MSNTDFSSPRAAARAFTPKLTELVEHPLYSSVWSDPDLSPRDRSLITIASLIALGHTDELPAHLLRGVQNGLSKTELSAAITHLAFYVGFPAAISASACASGVLGTEEGAQAAD